MEKLDSTEYFKKHSYLKIEQFISIEETCLLYDYVKLSAYRLAHLEETTRELGGMDDFHYGTFTDKQVMGDYSKYGDLIFDTLLIRNLPRMENLTGLDLVPTYSYHRLYTTGSELTRHKDRPSCEISTTLCLGYDVSNIDREKYPNWNWPMFVGPKSGEEGTKGLPINLNPGDMIIYRGCDLEHWREPFAGLNHAQVFLHYYEKNDEYNNLYDGRAVLGLPTRPDK